MDCSQQTPPGIAPDQILDIITRMDTDTEDQGYSHNPADTKVPVTMTPTGVVPGHIIEIVDATIVLHDAIIPVLTVIAVTHQINDHPHIAILQLIQQIAHGPDHILHIKQQRKLHINLHPILTNLQQNLKIGDIPES